MLFPFNLMGVRGKKGPSTSTFFGTRGKKDNGSVNQEDTNSAESLLSLLYLLANDKDYMKHNDVKEDADFEVTGKTKNFFYIIKKYIINDFYN